MARKRMFDTEIVDTDDFLDMPSSTQNLYFHYGMRADDDGFVSSPKKIMNLVKATIDDLKLLITKGYLISFSNVIVIRHWKLNNYIRKDRYRPTIYFKELSQLWCDENEIYFLESEKKKGLVYHLATIGIPGGIPSIDKYSIDSNSNIYNIIEQEFGRPISPMECEIINTWDYPIDVIKLAIKEAVSSNNCAIKYIDRIIFNWKKKNIKSVADAEKSIADFRENKKKGNSLPDIAAAGANYYQQL